MEIRWAIIYFIRSLVEWGKNKKTAVPQQLVNLIKQAHTGQQFATEWHISVGADMREKLCYPLTSEQVEIIKATSYPPQEGEFEYKLSSYKFTANELSGVVLVTIRYRDDLKELDLNFKNVPIRIQCTSKPSKGWRLSSVEYL